MSRGRNAKLSLIKIVAAGAVVTGSAWWVYGGACGCFDLKDISNFKDQQEKSGKTYKTFSDYYKDLETKQGQPTPYDDDQYNQISRQSVKGQNCEKGKVFQGASTQGLTCSVSYSFKNCDGGDENPDDYPCLKSLVDAHEKVHVDACNSINSEHSFLGLHGNYKSNQSMLDAMNEEVKAHKAGADNAQKTLDDLKKECSSAPEAKSTVKPKLMEIVRNLFR
jgi:hypothetical protein